MGRGHRKGMVEGNAKLMPRINEILGYDFTPHFADLWTEEGKDWEKHRKDYHRAITICLEENYYGRLSQWCEEHGIALTGHPAKSTDLGAQKYFHIPGQDSGMALCGTRQKSTGWSALNHGKKCFQCHGAPEPPP